VKEGVEEGVEEEAEEEMRERVGRVSSTWAKHRAMLGETKPSLCTGQPDEEGRDHIDKQRYRSHICANVGGAQICSFLHPLYAKIVLLGMGQFDRKGCDKIANAEVHIPHLCHLEWCINPAHLVLESARIIGQLLM